MMAKIRKFMSPAAKEKILHSMPYRILSRIRLYGQAIRFSCELTTRCNAGCDICTRSLAAREGRLSVGDMPEDVVKRCVEGIELFHRHGKRVCFEPMGLGEPLLYEPLFELFGAIKRISEGIGIVLVTNGILLDEDRCKKLISIGIDEVSISMNAVDSPSYRLHMGVNAYEQVRHNVENLLDMRNKSGNRAPSVFVQYIDYHNDPGLFRSVSKQWLRMMRDNDKSYVHPVVNQGGFCRAGGKGGSPAERYPCTSPLWRIAVKINGDVYPCCSCFYSGSKKIASLYMGNVRTQSLYDLFAGKDSKRLKIVKSMREDDYSRLPECKICDVNTLGCNCYFRLPASLRIKKYNWL